MRQQSYSLEKSTDSLSKALEDVNAGKLKGLRGFLEKRFCGGGRGKSTRAFLPPAHLKVGGLAGVVASFGFHKDRLERLSLSENAAASPAMRRRTNLKWKAALEDHPLKAFAGCSLSLQLGRMKRRFLSFTSALAQCECTIPLPLAQAMGQSSFTRRVQSIAASSRRNLMLGNVPLRPLVNLSFAQQVALF